MYDLGTFECVQKLGIIKWRMLVTSGKYTCMNRISSSHDGSPCWCANLLYVVIIQFDAVLGQLVDVGGLNLRIVVPDIIPAEVIRENKQNIRRFRIF